MQARPPRKRTRVEKTNRLAAVVVGPLPLLVTGIAREGEVFGKLRTVPDLRSGPSASSNPSYPSLTGVGGDYKFPWVPTLVPACCMVSSTGSVHLPELSCGRHRLPKEKTELVQTTAI